MTHEAGMIILIKLLQICDPDSLTTPEGISYSDFGARFGVSRTQVRKILEGAQSEGLMRLTKKGGHLVQLTPPLVAAFDRFLAAGVSRHDLIYNLAHQSVA